MSWINDLGPGTELFKNKNFKKFNPILSFESERKAENSIDKMEKAFYKANTNTERLNVCKALRWAGIQSSRASKNPNLNTERKLELREISEEYLKAGKDLQKEYNKIK